MLSEHFAASVSTGQTKTANTKDVSVFVFESQPHSAQRASFKKSATAQNCLAVSASHVYAAQADKAVVHVYSRDKGNQEATIPFPERITCVALACEETVLVLGSQTGRIFLWETHTGRLVITSQAHLQSVTALAVDPTSNFLLSGSADASIHVWSLPGLLSFSTSASQGHHGPLHTLSGHRAGITALAVGHSSGFCNILVSASSDKSCIVWDYHSNQLLRTVLLPAVPSCLALDPADRAFYTAYEDGSVQMVDFYSAAFSAANPDSPQHPLYDEAQAAMPVQPSPTTRWSPPSTDVGATLSAMLNYDGSVFVTGHANGNILTWDIPLARYSSTFTTVPLPGPVTNLVALPIKGFLDTQPPRLSQVTIVKPKHAAFDKPELDGAIPGNYNLNLQFTRTLPIPHFSASEPSNRTDFDSDFLASLTHPCFPSSLLSDSLAELSSWNQSSRPQPQSSTSTTIPTTTSTPPALEPRTSAAARQPDTNADFMSLDSPATTTTQKPTLEQQNDVLKAEVAALKRVQRASLVQMEKLRKEKVELLARVRQDVDRRLEDELKGGAKSERAWKKLAVSGEYVESDDDDDDDEEEEE